MHRKSIRRPPRRVPVPFARVLFFCVLLCGVPSARADDAQADVRAYSATVRALGGLGGGQLGPAARVVVSAEGWFSDHAGVGAFLGASAQETPCVFCSVTKNETSQFAGLSLAARTAPRGTYGLLSVGVGLASGWRWDTVYPSWLGPRDPPPQPPGTSYGGAFASVSGAFLYRRRAFEIGPAVVASVTTWGNLMVTANLALGMSIP